MLIVAFYPVVLRPAPFSVSEPEFCFSGIATPPARNDSREGFAMTIKKTGNDASLLSLRGAAATKQSHAPPGLPRLRLAMTVEKGSQ